MGRAGQIIDEALELTNRKDPTMRGRALHALDRALQHYAERRPWDGLKRWEDFTADGTRYLTLPARIRKILSVSDVTNKMDIEAGSHWNRTAQVPWAAGQAAATAYEWRDLGVVPVIAEPDGAQLRIEASVSEPQSLVIRGMVRDSSASGSPLELYPLVETYTVGGTSYSITDASFVTVDSIEKSITDGSADITIWNHSTAKILARIPAGERSPAYQRIEFLYQPTAGNQVRVEYFARPARLVSETGAVPADVDHDYLVWRVAGDMEFLANEGQSAQVAWAKADGMMQEKRVAEQTQGEKSIQIQPDASYFRMEGADLDGTW